MKLQFLASAIFLCLFGMSKLAHAHDRPFWTEKSSYREGDQVYFVGLATKAKSIETGREAALENARKELKGFLQSRATDGITFNTQMTWEEKNKDETYDVYRLMWVSVDEIVAFRQQIPSDDGAKVEERLSKLPRMTQLTTAYVRFNYPEGWNCNLLKGIWVCGSRLAAPIHKGSGNSIGDVQNQLYGMHQEYLIAMATIASKWDTIDNYAQYLSRETKKMKVGDKTITSEIIYSRKRAINGKTWVESLQKNSEAYGYRTLYLATTHNFRLEDRGRVELAILLSILIPEDQFQSFSGALDTIASSITLNKYLPRNILPASRSTASIKSAPSRNKKGRTKFKPTEFEPLPR